MSYPQASADQAVTNGRTMFRLFTPLVSPGDIYESSQSGYGFVIGPNSDVANANIAYFDPTVPNFVNLASISAGAGFSGFTPIETALYSPSNRPGRILLWPTDIFDPTYVPAGFAGATDFLYLDSPNIDIIEYFNPTAAQLQTRRADKATLWQDIPIGGVGVGRDAYIMVPYYGRQTGFVVFTNDNVGDVTIQIDGINFAFSQDPGPGGGGSNPRHQITPILAPGAVVTGSQISKQITAAANGYFDYLQIRLRPAGLFAATINCALRVRVSDR